MQESELTRRLSLQHAASSTHLPAIANSLQPEQHSQAPGLPQAQGGEPRPYQSSSCSLQIHSATLRWLILVFTWVL